MWKQKGGEMRTTLNSRVDKLEQAFDITNKGMTLEERVAAIENITCAECPPGTQDITIGEMAQKV